MDSDVRSAWLLVAAHDLHPGDPHPTKRGWVLAEDLGPRGEPVFYREAGHAKRMAFWADVKAYGPWMLGLGVAIYVWFEAIVPWWQRLSS